MTCRRAKCLVSASWFLISPLKIAPHLQEIMYKQCCRLFVGMTVANAGYFTVDLAYFSDRRGPGRGAKENWVHMAVVGWMVGYLTVYFNVNRQLAQTEYFSVCLGGLACGCSLFNHQWAIDLIIFFLLKSQRFWPPLIFPTGFRFFLRCWRDLKVKRSALFARYSAFPNDHVCQVGVRCNIIRK